MTVNTFQNGNSLENPKKFRLRRALLNFLDAGTIDCENSTFCFWHSISLIALEELVQISEKTMLPIFFLRQENVKEIPLVALR